MHADAYNFVARSAPKKTKGLVVVECGSRDINGTLRPLFPGSDYTGVDIIDGPGVDVDCDFIEYEHPTPVDVVLCCEVAEHFVFWPELLYHAEAMLKPGGLLIFTAAGPNRKPHSAVDGGALREGEFYENVTWDDLDDILQVFESFTIETTHEDIYAVAVK